MDGPFFWPEATHLPPPSSLPMMAERLGGTLTFPRWRVLLEWLSPSTLKVYVVAIATHHNAVDGRSLGMHDLIVSFLRGARRLNPPRPPLVPFWDLATILAGLQRDPFEPLDSVELKFLSAKTALLTALISNKRFRDLQAFSVSEECLVFRPAYSHVVLRPRPGFVSKVPTTPFRDQVVNLQALPSEEADPALAFLCLTLSWDHSRDTCPRFPPRLFVIRRWTCKHCSSLFITEVSRKGRLSPSRGWPTGWWMPSPWHTSPKARCAPWGWELTWHGVSPPLMRWCTVPLWQTFAELQTGWHRAPSWDSTVFASSQFLPVCCVIGKWWEGSADVTLTAPFLLTRGCERLFSSPVEFPGWRTLVEYPTARPAVRLGRSVWHQAQYWDRCPYGLIPFGRSHMCILPR